MTSFIFIKDLNEKYQKKMTTKLELSFNGQNTTKQNWL